MDTLAELKNSGKSIEEVRDFAEERKLNVHHWFFSTDLTSYYRGGRITKTAQIFGTMLNICPLLNMDNNGKLIPRTKYRGKKKVIEEIVNRMVEHADGGLDYSGKCYISESACYDDARDCFSLPTLLRQNSKSSTARSKSTALAPLSAHIRAPVPLRSSSLATRE